MFCYMLNIMQLIRKITDISYKKIVHFLDENMAALPLLLADIKIIYLDDYIYYHDTVRQREREKIVRGKLRETISNMK